MRWFGYWRNAYYSLLKQYNRLKSIYNMLHDENATNKSLLKEKEGLLNDRDNELKVLRDEVADMEQREAEVQNLFKKFIEDYERIP